MTLDDNQVAPMGPHLGLRRASLGGCLLASAVIIAGLTGQVDIDRNVGDVMTGMAYIFAFLLMAVLLTFMALVGLFSLHTYVSVLRAERFSRVFIPDIKAIESVAESVKRVSRRVFGPSLIVVRVSAEVWQETVQRFISDSSVIVVDISEPTESLLWEISRLKPLLKTKCILLGHRTRLREMTAHPREIDRAVCEIIDGHDVLVYSSHSAKSERRFAKALRNRLASIAM